MNFHAEGQFGEFQQAELRQHSEGAQLRNLCEETRTPNVSVAPEVTRLQAREAQLSTRVSTLQNRDEELQRQLPNHHQDARINALLNQIQTTKNSMKTRNELTQQLQTSSMAVSHLQTFTGNQELTQHLQTSTLATSRVDLLIRETQWGGINLAKIVTQKIQSLQHLAHDEAVLA